MTKRQQAVVERFRDAVNSAAKAGLSVVADSDGVCLRFVITKIARNGADLRKLGAVVPVHDACGGAGPAVSGIACNYGVK
jgi:hypothetical protein